MAESTKVFEESSVGFLPTVFEVNFTVDLSIWELFEPWLWDHLNSTLRDNAGFRDAEVFQRDPQNNHGDADVPNADRVHKYITVLFEVEDRASIERYLAEEAPKIEKHIQETFVHENKSVLVVTSQRVLYPVSLWAKRKALGAHK